MSATYTLTLFFSFLVNHARRMVHSPFIFVAYARAYPYPILALLHNVHTLWWEGTVYSFHYMIGDIQFTA
jgi:hypothetical protein